MTETQERFLRAVVDRVGLAGVVEVHLFPSIRRGTVETGMAVLAVATTGPVLEVSLDDTIDSSPDGFSDVSAVEPAVESPIESHDASQFEPQDAPFVESDESALESVNARDDQSPAPRLRILTASYRHTIKGIDRGKWMVDVTDEAIAPLDAVEAVLRGVRHRSTEPADPELIAPAVLAELAAGLTIAPAA
jgi:hypothetical protein